MEQVSTTKTKIIQYSGVLLMLFASRSVSMWADMGAAFSYTVFFVFSFLNLFFLQRARISKDSNMWYAVIFITAILLNRFAFNTDATGNMWIGVILPCISCLMFYSAYTKEEFAKIMLNIMAVLMFISVLLFFLDPVVTIPNVVVTQIDAWHTSRMFYCFNIGKTRLSGIWGEAGACQMFINVVFLLYANKIKNNQLKRDEKVKLLILLVALLCTTSTMGYMVLCVILIAIYYPTFRQKSIGYQIITLPFIAAAIYLLLSSPAVVDKFAQGADDSTMSFGKRVSDNLACLQMALEKPFTGYGFGTTDFTHQSEVLGNMTSSNGILTIAARLGIWWVLPYLIALYKGIKKADLGIPAILALIAFAMMESDGDYIEFPISYVLLFSFKDGVQQNHV